MKKYVPLLILIGNLMAAQEPIHNFGNLKIHTNGGLGFHSDLINDGSFDENLGLAGFFNDESIIVSGAFRPIFNDIEVMLNEKLFLDIGIGVKNHLNFVDGTIITPRTLTDINANFINDASYSGENNSAKVNGYAMMTNKQKFWFPIGDDDRIRPLLIEAENDTINAKSAYFLENPNNPSTFGESFDTSSVSEGVLSVSTVEFWHLEANTSARVELLWDDRSEIKNLVETIDNLRIVGWHKEEEKWKNLGIAAGKGDLDSGRIVSEFFNTADYSILTFGSSSSTIDIQLTNYLITPNNDGVNDFLVLNAIALSPNNQLKIYNRWGRAVYIEDNYTNGFNGKSNTGIVIKKSKVLPVGLYFYTIELKDIDVIHQGYLYINE